MEAGAKHIALQEEHRVLLSVRSLEEESDGHVCSCDGQVDAPPAKKTFFLLSENGMRKVSSTEHFAKLAATQAAAA
jgi:hypothetical protein